ncbi:acyltransferase family protein [Limosilactobacillus sp.]|jgi:peptidoglycan/LPS O-acetylase OafA/YrhL|uniref:acyltransferase family protein n=1 Tax=Limosilactobacillus sp. TaxID=2773925 RepID=UPI00359FA832
MKMVGRKHQYITGIDGLRTLAVLGVIIYHLLPNVLQGGYLGVPLFLLISGYFVTYQFSQRLDYHQHIDIWHFYHKRFKRLYPVLIAMLFLTTAYITLFAHELLHNIRMIIMTNLLWVYNWWEIGHGQSYFDQFGGASPFTHLWTLGVEAQFYLLWPLIITLLFMILRKKKLVRRVILLLAIASAVEMAILYDPTNVNRVYYGTDTRAFSLLLGSWLGLAWPLNRLNPHPRESLRGLLNMVGIIMTILTVVGFFTLNGQSAWTYHGGMFFYSVIGLLLMATILHPGSKMNDWFSNSFFHWVGQRSYGIYVYQYPVMVFYERIVKVGVHPILNSIIELAIIGLISEASYRYWERPLASQHWSALVQPFHWSWQQWVRTVTSLLVLAVAVFGMAQPDHTPKKTAVQQRIERNHQKANKHNQEIAAGKKVKTNPNANAKQYALSPGEVHQAQKLKITAIGDSVMADAAGSIQKLMPLAYVDAQVGRQGSATPAVIKQLESQGHLNKIVVLNLGTNGAMSPQTINEIVKTIGPGHQIYWMTAHVPTKPWQQTVNDEIEGAAKKYPNVHVVDWYGMSEKHSEWFASDNVHMGQEGNNNYARLIVKSILNNQKGQNK